MFGILVLHAFNSRLDHHLAALEIPSWAQEQVDAQRIKLAGAEVPAGLSSKTSAELEHAIDDSFVAGFRLVMLLATALALASAVTASLMIEGAASRSSSPA